jgi:hypothetical protein
MGNKYSREIGKFKKNETVDLSNMGYRNLPKEIKLLEKNCKELILCNNEMQNIHENIKLLKNLIKLDFSNNNMNYWCPYFPISLEEIYAHHNRLFYSPIICSYNYFFFFF